MSISKTLYTNMMDYYHRRRVCRDITWDEFTEAVKRLNARVIL